MAKTLSTSFIFTVTRLIEALNPIIDHMIDLDWIYLWLINILKVYNWKTIESVSHVSDIGHACSSL